MSDLSLQEDRTEALSRHLDRLLVLATAMPDLSRELRFQAGLVATLGLRLRMHPGERTPLSLRRHEVVMIPETITLLDHLAGLRAGGLTSVDLASVRDLLETRSQALAAEIRSLDGRMIARLDPGISLDLSQAQLDGEQAIAAFRAALGRPAGQGGQVEAQGTAEALFLDYVAADLPEEDRLEAARRIAGHPDLARYAHDELLAIAKLRHVVSRVETYGFGVAARRRPLFSKARRAFLWGAPRIGLVMVTHLPSWRRTPEIGDVLLDVRRYERHMKDLAKISEDDDYFSARDPLVRAVRADADRILRRSLSIVSGVKAGPSAFRFDPDFLEILPGPQANQAQAFLARSERIVNAMAVSGVGGKGERDLALAHRATPPAETSPGILTRIRKALA
jgi:hypothetical protein